MVKKTATSKPAVKPPAPPKPGRSAPELVKVARRAEDARVKRAKALVSDIRARMRSVGTEFFAIGESLKTLLDEELYRALGYATFKEMLDGEQLGAPTQAFKIMAVASAFSATGLAELGIERAYALITYTRATPTEDDPAALFAENAPIAGKPVLEHTVADLQRARAEVAAAEGKAKPQTPAEKRQAAREKKGLRLVTTAMKASGLPKAEVELRGQRVIATWSLDTLLPE